MTKFKPSRGYTKQDWDEVSDNAEATDEELAQAVPFAEAFPEKAVTLRLDPETVERFKAQGPDWRARMGTALKRAAGG